MRSLDFSSWQALASTLLGLAVVTLMMVGIRLAIMQRAQTLRERENRQINERLRTLIAAYRTLGGSFTGDLTVDPTHLCDVRRRGESAIDTDTRGAGELPGSHRSRRIRDAVEAALSDIILLGTEEQVRLAARAAAELAVGRPVHTAKLVVSLRNFIRQVLELDPVPARLEIPVQGPARPSTTPVGGAGKDGGKDSKQGGGSGEMSGGAAADAGMGLGSGGGFAEDEDSRHH
jgi:hypothetical protein